MSLWREAHREGGCSRGDYRRSGLRLNAELTGVCAADCEVVPGACNRDRFVDDFQLSGKYDGVIIVEVDGSARAHIPDRLILCGLYFNKYLCPFVFHNLTNFGIRYS